MVTAYLGIGSNLGDREKNINDALEYLSQTKGIKVTKVSSLYETEPVGGPAQGKFLNGAIRIETELSARELLMNLQSIEKRLGRVRRAIYGPRTLDLDILTYGEKIINEEDLKVPHPEMHKREFVLKPLKEVMSNE